MTTERDKLIDLCDRGIAQMEADLARVRAGKPLVLEGDWERGYHKGYDRALSQLVELVEARSHSYAVDDLVRDLAEKLRKEVLDDHS